MTGDEGSSTHSSSLRAWATALGGVVLFMLTMRAVGWVTEPLVEMVGGEPAGPRGTVTVRASISVLGLLAGLGLLVAYLRRSDRSLADIGWMRPAGPGGWTAAAVFTALWIALILGSALGGRAPTLELSWFNLYVSLVTAVGAGVVEEAVFRGFVMDELKRGGDG